MGKYESRHYILNKVKDIYRLVLGAKTHICLVALFLKQIDLFLVYQIFQQPRAYIFD